MLEYIVIFSIVAVAAWFVGKRLWREAQGSGCSGCNRRQGSMPDRLIQIKPIDRKKI